MGRARSVAVAAALALHAGAAAFLGPPLPRAPSKPELAVHLDPEVARPVPASAPRAVPRPPTAVLTPQVPAVMTSSVPEPEAAPAAAEPGDEESSGTESLVPGVSDAAAPGLAETYRQAVREAVARQKAYPNAARVRGQQGTTVVRFVLDEVGVLREPPAVLRSSGFSRLDEAARAAVSSARFPAPPPGFETSFDLAVEFVLNSSP